MGGLVLYKRGSSPLPGEAASEGISTCLRGEGAGVREGEGGLGCERDIEAEVHLEGVEGRSGASGGEAL